MTFENFTSTGTRTGSYQTFQEALSQGLKALVWADKITIKEDGQPVAVLSSN